MEMDLYETSENISLIILCLIFSFQAKTYY